MRLEPKHPCDASGVCRAQTANELKLQKEVYAELMRVVDGED